MMSSQDAQGTQYRLTVIAGQDGREWTRLKNLIVPSCPFRWPQRGSDIGKAPSLDVQTPSPGSRTVSRVVLAPSNFGF